MSLAFRNCLILTCICWAVCIISINTYKVNLLLGRFGQYWCGLTCYWGCWVHFWHFRNWKGQFKHWTDFDEFQVDYEVMYMLKTLWMSCSTIVEFGFVWHQRIIRFYPTAVMKLFHKNSSRFDAINLIIDYVRVFLLFFHQQGPFFNMNFFFKLNYSRRKVGGKFRTKMLLHLITFVF